MLETSILIGLVVPGDTIVLAASTGITSPAQYFAMVAAVVIGSLIGESIGFALGRYFGPKIRRSRLGARIGEDHWVRAENYLDKRGGIAVFLSRFLPVLHALVPVTVGMSAMRYRTFMMWTVPACLIWTFAYVTIGTLAASTYREAAADQLNSRIHYAGYVFVGVIALFLLAMVLVRHLLHRHQAKHMAAEDPIADTGPADEA
jgi:membrane protein DedA with SNARE-associated domain